MVDTLKHNPYDFFMSKSAYDFSVKDIKGKSTPLSAYAGKVSLIVNVASKCGFTPQYKDLEAIQEHYASKGFTVLGFPCNQFLAQEPGTDEEIHQFCTSIYGVTFPMFSKVDVNGKNASPLFEHLKKEAGGLFFWTRAVKWNFTKFLVGKDGKVIARFAPTVNPKDIVPAIEKALAE